MPNFPKERATNCHRFATYDKLIEISIVYSGSIRIVFPTIIPFHCILLELNPTSTKYKKAGVEFFVLLTALQKLTKLFGALELVLMVFREEIESLSILI